MEGRDVLHLERRRIVSLVAESERLEPVVSGGGVGLGVLHRERPGDDAVAISEELVSEVAVGGLMASRLVRGEVDVRGGRGVGGDGHCGR